MVVDRLAQAGEAPRKVSHFAAQWYAGRGRFNEAVAEYRGGLERDPGERILVLGLAGAERNLGNREQALASVRERVETDPADLEALRMLVGLERLSGRHIRAMILAAKLSLAAAKVTSSVVGANPSGGKSAGRRNLTSPNDDSGRN